MDDITKKRLEMIFNEWMKRYSENPDDFSNFLDKNGNPVSDYGEKCAIYFCELANEMDEDGLLPKPIPAI